MHARSCSVNFMVSEMKRPLFKILWWVRVAPLGNPVVPDVNWMLIGSSNCNWPASAASFWYSGRGRGRRHRRSAPRRHALVPDRDDQAQIGELGCAQIARSGGGEFGRQLAQHSEVVAGLEPGGGDQRRAASLVQRVFEFGQPIGRVDVDEDQPGLGGSELGDGPFGVVRRPDADARAAFEAERHQPGGEGIDPLL